MWFTFRECKLFALSLPEKALTELHPVIACSHARKNYYYRHTNNMLKFIACPFRPRHIIDHNFINNVSRCLINILKTSLAIHWKDQSVNDWPLWYTYVWVMNSYTVKTSVKNLTPKLTPLDNSFLTRLSVKNPKNNALMC